MHLEIAIEVVNGEERKREMHDKTQQLKRSSRKSIEPSGAPHPGEQEPRQRGRRGDLSSQRRTKGDQLSDERMCSPGYE